MSNTYFKCDDPNCALHGVDLATKATEEFASEFGAEGRYWWLSFADGKRAKVSQFLGVCVVRAPGFVTAIMAASSSGCNPGVGEVLGFPVELSNDDVVDVLVKYVHDEGKPDPAYRLIGREEATKLYAMIGNKMAERKETAS